MIVNEPLLPFVKVSVDAAVLPYVNVLMVTAPVDVPMVGWFVIAACPICTSSAELGGVLGVPLIVVQLAAVSQAVLVPPVQRTVPAANSEVLQTRMMLRIETARSDNRFIILPHGMCGG